MPFRPDFARFLYRGRLPVYAIVLGGLIFTAPVTAPAFGEGRAGSCKFDRQKTPPAKKQAPAASPKVAVDADEEYKSGNVAYSWGSYAEAIGYFTKAVTARPTFADAFYQRGICYEAKQNWKAAIADFTAALANKPTLASALVERGRSLSLTGDSPAAEKDLVQATVLQPEQPVPYLLLANAYFRSKRYDECAADYTKYLELTPKPAAWAYNNCGIANYATKHYKEAVEDFHQASETDAKYKTNPPIYLGGSLFQLAKYAEALAAYTAYLTGHPADPIGFRSRAFAELQLGNYHEAVADYEACLKLTPNDDIAMKGLMTAHEKIASGASAPTFGALEPSASTLPLPDNVDPTNHKAIYTKPATPPIPDSLKTQVIEASVTVRVVFMALGQTRATIIQSSGIDALDAAALAAFTDIKFTPAYEDGSPLDETHDFIMKFHNKG